MFNKEKSIELTINKQECIKCKKCINNCPSEYLIFSNDEVCENNFSHFGCIQCGYCMIICPKNCISISAEGISNDKVIHLEDNSASFDTLKNLFLKRRSIRKFTKEELSSEIIEKIIAAASTAPMSIPPSEVKVLVVKGFDNVQCFAQELTDQYERLLKILPILLVFLRMIIKPTQFKLIKDFVKPLAEMTVLKRKKGEDVLFYDAPVLLYFYGTEVSERDDQVIAATHAYLAAEALGLGTCIIGSVPPLLHRNKNLMKKYLIKPTDNSGMAFVLGYPASTYTKGVIREFKEVNFIENK